MLTFLKKLLKNRWFIFLLVVILGVVIYFLFFKKSAAAPQYVMSAVKKGTLTVTLSGTGQISAVSQIDISTEGSGKVVSVNATVGQSVKAGDKLAVIDETSNNLSLTQARASLASAQANYDKVVAGTTADDLKISQLSVDSAAQSLATAQSDLTETQKSTAISVAQAQKDLDDLENTSATQGNSTRNQILVSSDSAIIGVKNALDAMAKLLTDQNAKNVLGALDSSAFNSANASYQKALPFLDPAVNSLAAAKADRTDANISTSVTSTLSLLNETLTALNSCFYLLEQSITSSSFSQSSLDSYKSSMNSQISSINGDISSLQTAWQNLTDALTTAQNTLTNAQLSADQQLSAAQSKIESSQTSLDNAKIQLAKLQAPVATSDLRSAQSQLISAQSQLQSAQSTYDKNIITAPIDGQIAAVNIQPGINISSGAAAITIVTPQQLAIIQFNEVDVAKIKVGQDVSLTFDALPDLTVKGKVTEVAGVGVTTQGVVNYQVKISFDPSANQVKPGMSVTAVITTSSRDGVLLVPSEAIKTLGARSYVETLPNYTPVAGQRGAITSTQVPVRKFVTVGDSNDTQTEITAGLNEGDYIITRTITSTVAAATTTSGNSLFGGGAARALGGGGFGGGGGGGVRTTGGATGGGAASGTTGTAANRTGN